MDATLSFIMANMAQCYTSRIALDPFCGTGKHISCYAYLATFIIYLGGILLACAEFGSYVIGSDFDWRVLTAKGTFC
jgi:tRNA G10  N-methylase Trm11